MSLLETDGRFKCQAGSKYDDEIKKIDFRVTDADHPKLGAIAVQLKTELMEEREVAELLSMGVVPLEVIGAYLDEAVNDYGEVVNDEAADVLLAEMTLAIEEYGRFIREQVLGTKKQVSREDLMAIIHTVQDKIKELYRMINEQRFGSNGPRVFDPV